jgi:hypothetical protein
MTTSNHRPSSRKRAARKVSKKPAVKKPVAKKKPFPARASTKPTAKSAVRRNLLAKEALKFVDEAASVLRIGIREGVKTTDRSRIVAKRKAHNLLGKASRNLSKAIEDSASALQDIIRKI